MTESKIPPDLEKDLRRLAKLRDAQRALAKAWLDLAARVRQGEISPEQVRQEKRKLEANRVVDFGTIIDDLCRWVDKADDGE